MSTQNFTEYSPVRQILPFLSVSLLFCERPLFCEGNRKADHTKDHEDPSEEWVLAASNVSR